MSDTPLESPYPQYEREVDEIPVINGAHCLIWVDVTRTGSALGLSMSQSQDRGPTDQELADAIREEIQAQLADRCPEGNVKLELQYHYGSKPIHDGPAKTRLWQQQNSIEIALRDLASEPGAERVEKVYLKGCESDGDLNLVDAAFQMPGTRYVVTVADIIFLVPPGEITGGDTGFRPQPVGVTIWEEKDGKQVGKKSRRKVGADERYNIHTGTVEKKSTPRTGPCPTSKQFSGAERMRLHYGTAAAVEQVIDMIKAIGEDVVASGAATADAAARAADEDCPNPHCQTKRLAEPVITRAYFMRIQSFLLSLIGVRRYTAYLHYEWTADLWCE